jgi:hypothetical protein
MPPAGFDNPIDSIFAEKPLPLDDDRWHTWAIVSIEFVERRSRFRTGFLSFSSGEKRFSVDVGPSRSPLDRTRLIHVQPLHPGSDEQSFVQCTLLLGSTE